MSCCATCGGATIGGCSCNNVGCLGRVLIFFGWGIVVGIFCMVLFFIVPGLLMNLFMGRFLGSFEEFMDRSLDDRLTWVFSAITWICLGLWKFHQATRTVQQQPTAPTPGRDA